ncbi:uncharacterized protein STAUR_3577 [Stigmatella aurantiaca DW4/3-1]|uniref:Uncharacterized protein n=1 Tax=Stigmatella aurantiaca (strain DW4/3-1) TaxID=378806 RepID=E3FDV2_STIAD|nr:uncharacterized protein STAUR_3577 [Stigmatella aurantiaca DW4/3-1]
MVKPCLVVILCSFVRKRGLRFSLWVPPLIATQHWERQATERPFTTVEQLSAWSCRVRCHEPREARPCPDRRGAVCPCLREPAHPGLPGSPEEGRVEPRSQAGAVVFAQAVEGLPADRRGPRVRGGSRGSRVLLTG